MLATAWLALGAVLSVITVVIAAARQTGRIDGAGCRHDNGSRQRLECFGGDCHARQRQQMSNHNQKQ